MCGAPKISTPEPPKVPDPPPPPPTKVDPAVKEARNQNRLQAALAAGRASTILTGSQGLVESGDDRLKPKLGL